MEAPNPMSTGIFEIVPAAQREAAERAVRQTFPDAAAEALSPLHGGLSGQLVMRLTVAGRAYVLRVCQVPPPVDIPQSPFATAQIAADLGVAPRVHYADARAGICITDFIESQPLWQALRRPEGWAQLGALLRTLHSGPAFPVEVDTFTLLKGLQAQLLGTGAPLPEWVLRYFERFAAVEAVVRPHLISLPCHNDLNPNNMLFDGARMWLIDWEAASMNDPMLDLGNILHWFTMEPAQEAVFLEAYFGSPPGGRQRAKLTLMRQVTRCFYTAIFMLLAVQRSRGRLPPMAERATLPAYAEVLRGLGAGTFPIGAPEGMQIFSLVIANEAAAELELPTFAEALALLGAP